MSEHDELVPGFLVECEETLDALDEELIALESAPQNHELLNSVFRRVHNIKGMCGFLDFTILETIAHAGEDLLDKLRSGRIALDGPRTDALLSLSDAMRAIVKHVREHGDEGENRYQPLVAALRAALLDPANNAKSPSAVNRAKEPPSERETEAHALLQRNALDNYLRVDVGLLDTLMNLAGELVLARNQILQITKDTEDPTLRSITTRLSSITSDLQEGVMKTRLQPISTLWDKFPRVVRDLSHSTGKSVQLTVRGQGTELDKAILEAIKDPLVHLMRNAIDHGIETPTDRVAAGKPETGQLSLSASPEGGNVIIELTDDGQGLNTERIREKAIERGIVTREQSETLSTSQINSFIFAAGFSTASKVTNLSGRGVGMDVVKSNIESVGGQVEIESTFGAGTTIRLKIPLTLSIIPTLLVTCGRESFALPEVAITEVIRLNQTEHSAPVVCVGDASFIELRGALLPLIFIDKRLGMNDDSTNQERMIVIVSIDGRRAGLVVDRVHDIQEIVVKPLDSRLESLPCFAGATILGDGRVVLILDPSALVRELGLRRIESVESLSSGATDIDARAARDEHLIIELAPNYLGVLPLSAVHRIEKVPSDALHRIGEVPVMHYRDEILPLARVTIPKEGVSGEPRELSVVVITTKDGAKGGLIVSSIIDIAQGLHSVTTISGERYHTQVGIIQNRSVVVIEPELVAMTRAEDLHPETNPGGIA